MKYTPLTAPDNLADLQQYIDQELYRIADAGADSFSYTPAGDGIANRTIEDKLREVVSVKDFGAVGNGIADDTAAINNALTAGAGGDVYFPAGNYLISGTLSVPVGTKAVGAGTCDIYNPATVGATLSVTHTGSEAVLLGRGARIDGINFWYPNQVTTSPPTAYDWAIVVSNADTAVQNGNNPYCSVRNLVIHNAYKGINLGGDNTDKIPSHGMEIIQNVKMYALHTGISTSAFLVECEVVNCTFSPQFWTASVGTAVRQWAMTSGNACIEYMGGQGLQMTDVLMFGHARGIYAHGTGIHADLENLSFFKASNVTFDGLRTCVEVTEEQGITGTFTGCTFLAADAFNSGFTTGKGVYLNDNEYPSVIAFSGCEFLGSTGDHVHDVQSTSTAINRLIFSGCTVSNANRGNDAGSYYNFYIDNTRVILTVNGCMLNNTNEASVTNFELLNAATVTITGNTISDSASTPFNIGTISDDSIIDDNACNVSANTASAATITYPSQASGVFQVTGTTNIDTINGVYARRPITLFFGGVLTVGDGTGNLNLAGNFVTTANDTLTLVKRGATLYEVSRSAN